MLEAGQNLTLVAESLNDRLGVGPALENLDRDALLKYVVAAHREVNRAHPSAADLAYQPVWTDLLVRADVRNNVP